MRLFLVWFATVGAACLFGQDPPPTPPVQVPTPAILENTGKPIVAPFACTDADIQTAGLSCTEEDPCPVFLEIAALHAQAHRILAAGNLHTASVTLSSILLASEDGGRTWSEPHTRIRGAGLDHIQFLDGDTGWISGVILSPLPREPFLLVTSDGGKTWRQRQILSETADNPFGTIQQFSFPAKDRGSLIIDRGPGSGDDRYELHESSDAGENWTIKQTSSKSLSLKSPPPAPSTDWRIRADAQAFHIEQRSGEKWSGVASFGVKLAPCKPQAAEAVKEH